MPRGKPFVTGQSKPIGSGRKKGTPNRATRAVKEFLAELVDDPEIQAVVRAKIKKGDAITFFRALEHVIGRAKASVEVTPPSGLMQQLLGAASGQRRPARLIAKTGPGFRAVAPVSAWKDTERRGSPGASRRC